MLRSKVLLITILVVALTATTWSSLGTMSVQLRNGQLRATPSFLGEVVATVAYGDRVDVLQQQGDWMEVKSAGNQSGWIHQSALTSKRIVLNAAGQNPQAAASGEEIALAGKGFNADVEKQFKKDHQNMDFTWVDRMEQFQVTPREMISFLEIGGVQPPKGGAQ